MTIDIKISSQQISAILKAIIVFNFLLLLGTYLVNSPGLIINQYLRLFLYQFDLATENILAAWYSSALLFSSAILSAFCFLLDLTVYKEKKDYILNYGWLVFVLCFAVLSFDELGSIHEYIGDYFGFSKAGDAILGSGKGAGWTLFYIVVAVTGLFMLLFSLMRLRKAGWSLFFLILGLICYLSNPFQEYFEIESMRSAADPVTWKRPVYFLIIEEGTEVFGSLFFIISIMMYAVHAGRRAGLPNDGIHVQTDISKNQLTRAAFILLLIIAAIIIAIAAMFPVAYAERQSGVPRNWAPSTIALLVAVYCFYFYSNGTGYDNQQRRSFLVFSVFSLCMSAYLGTDRFSYIFNSDHYRSSVLIRVAVMVAALIAFTYLTKIFTEKQNRSAAAACMVIMLIGVFSRRQYAPEISFIGFLLLLCILVANSQTNGFLAKNTTHLQQKT